MTQESMVIGWLSSGEKRIPLEGRLLPILWELAEMQKEINRTYPGRLVIEIHCYQEDIKISTKKWKEK